MQCGAEERGRRTASRSGGSARAQSPHHGTPAASSAVAQTAKRGRQEEGKAHRVAERRQRTGAVATPRHAGLILVGSEHDDVRGRVRSSQAGHGRGPGVDGGRPRVRGSALLREDAGREVAVTAVADDDADCRVLHLRRRLRVSVLCDHTLLLSECAAGSWVSRRDLLQLGAAGRAARGGGQELQQKRNAK